MFCRDIKMKFRKCSLLFAAAVITLFYNAFLANCRGDDSGTSGGTLAIGSGSLVMDPDSPMCLPISGDATGAVTFNAGVFVNDGASSLGSTITSGGTLTMAGTMDATSCGSVVFKDGISNSSDTMGLIKSGAGNLTLSGANTYSGTTAISSGTITVNGGILMQSNYTSSGTAIINNAGINTGTVVLSGSAALAGSTTDVNFSGGVLRFDNSNSMSSLTGGITTTTGKLVLGSTGILAGSGTICVASDAYNYDSAALTVSSISSGSSGLLTKSGTGTLVLSSSGAYTGATLTIDPIPGGPVSGTAPLTTVSSEETVPEPSVLVLLAVAALGYVFKALRGAIRKV